MDWLEDKGMEGQLNGKERGASRWRGKTEVHPPRVFLEKSPQDIENKEKRAGKKGQESSRARKVLRGKEKRRGRAGSGKKESRMRVRVVHPRYFVKICKQRLC